jgi:FkbM family methyltransferase
MPFITNAIRWGLQAFDIGIAKHSAIEELRARAGAADDLALLKTLPREHAPQLLGHLQSSKSQLRQDLFVLSELGFKSNGFFVEFGATNGVDLSNTHLLEKEFGWTGILAEPARCWQQALRSNRSASIESNCVWKDSVSTLKFNEVALAELSTVQEFSGSDVHARTRQNNKTYEVKTISLHDLLAKHGAPAQIDYLSVDTEGSEFEILSHFDFGKHSFRVITCEHNFTPMREKIFDLLSRHGYIRKFEALSRFDDWYVKAH